MRNPKSKLLYLLPAAIAAMGLLLTTNARAVMYSAQRVTGVSANAAGDFTLFTMSDGSLWGMGNNFSGQLGLDPAIVSKTNLPQRIVASDVTAISAGGSFTLFKKSDGSLWGLGRNSLGQLGLDSGVPSTFIPQQIVASVGAFSAGSDHSLFISANSLWAMGGNLEGQLGDNSYVSKYVPEQVFIPHGTRPGLSACAAGAGFTLFCATMASSGTVEGMGGNVVFELGGDFNFAMTNMPIFVASLTAASISSGFAHSLFIEPDGSLWGLGDNSEGQLGISGTNRVTSPQLIVSSGVIAAAAGLDQSLYLKSDGSLWGLGRTFGVVPIEIVASGVIAIATGDDSCFFAKSDGSLWGFGVNSSGELGDGSSTVNVANPKEIVATLHLRILPYGDKVVLLWPDNAFGYNLESNTNLSPDGWIPFTLAPLDIGGGQNEAIDDITTSSKFYRLSKPSN